MINLKQQNRQRVILSTGYEEFSESLKSYATRKTHDSEVANDLMQNTFLKTWTYMLKGGKVHLMKAFLFHILKALIVDGYRKPKIVSLDTLFEKGFEVKSNEDGDRQINIIDGEQVMALILELPVLYQKVLRMRYVQGLSLKEISQLTGQTKNAVTVQAHRGLEKLRVLYMQRHYPKGLNGL